MDELANFLQEHHLSISSVESFTVGSFANTIGSIPGISTVYCGSLVSYQTRIKRDVLGVDAAVIERYGVVSTEVAAVMAQRGQAMFQSDICIAFTGNAGPTALEGKPVGAVAIGIAFQQECETFWFQLEGQREDIKQAAIQLGIQELLTVLKKRFKTV